MALIDVKRIKNIIFDLGGVLLNIDYNLTSDAFQNLGIENFDDLYSQARQTTLFIDFERGKIGQDEFRMGLKNFIDVDSKSLDKAWNSMLLDFPKERIHLLEMLKSKYRLFLLSNTNEIHIKWYKDYLYKTFNVHDLSHIFEKEYYSFKTGLSKPDPAIFQMVLAENRLIPEETLFIDDSEQHVIAAAGLGLQAVHLKSPETIHDLFIGG